MFATPGEHSLLTRPCLTQSTYDGPPKLIVFGGNGFVGTRVCEEALQTGLAVVSINRSGAPKVSAPWTSEVEWISVSIPFFIVAGTAALIVHSIKGFASNVGSSPISAVWSITDDCLVLALSQFQALSFCNKLMY